jgi:ribonuclease HI
MEMTAVLMALRELLSVGGPVVVRSDSELLVKTLRWQYGRKANLDLWRELDQEVGRFPAILFEWVRSHAGDRYRWQPPSGCQDFGHFSLHSVQGARQIWS